MYPGVTRRLIRSVALSALAAAVVSAPHTAAAASVAALVIASGGSPFATCTAGGVSGEPANNIMYQNSEVEPNVAVNPRTVGTDQVNVIGVWQQDRWTTGAARGLVAGYSFDGGKSWAETPLPFSACASGDPALLRASDPWVSIGPDGTAYAIAIAFGSARSDVVAATSSDGGRTWTNVRNLIDDTTAFNDKESITADPVKPGVAYATWDRIPNGRNAPQPAEFAKTTDGGRTWHRAKTIVPRTAVNSGTIGNQIVVDPRSDTLYDVFLSFAERVQYATVCKKVKGKRQCKRVRKTVSNPIVDAFISTIRSTNGGKTWTATRSVTPLRYTAFDENAQNSLRTGGGLPEAAVDPATGKLYIVWSTGAFSLGKTTDVALSSSTDGGKHWSSPIKVNSPESTGAFTPAVAVNSAGVVGVTYYDLRALTPGASSIPAQDWFTSSTDGGAHFGDETHIAGPFDMKSAPLSGGYFLGDYQGLAAAGSSFLPFFAVSNTGNTANPSDIATTVVIP